MNGSGSSTSVAAKRWNLEWYTQDREELRTATLGLLKRFDSEGDKHSSQIVVATLSYVAATLGLLNLMRGPRRCKEDVSVLAVSASVLVIYCAYFVWCHGKAVAAKLRAAAFEEIVFGGLRDGYITHDVPVSDPEGVELCLRYDKEMAHAAIRGAFDAASPDNPGGAYHSRVCAVVVSMAILLATAVMSSAISGPCLSD